MKDQNKNPHAKIPAYKIIGGTVLILAGGFGSAVLELLADEGLTEVRVIRLGIPDVFVEHGTRNELLEDYGLTPQGIANAAYTFYKTNTALNRTSLNESLGAGPH